jgi:hypothetical protein
MHTGEEMWSGSEKGAFTIFLVEKRGDNEYCGGDKY